MSAINIGAVPKSLHKAITDQAASEGKTMKKWILDTLKAALKAAGREWRL